MMTKDSLRGKKKPMVKKAKKKAIKKNARPGSRKGRRVEDVKYVRLGDLKDWDMNPRENDVAASQLEEFISSFGFINPIIVDQNGIIRAGHTRKKSVQGICKREGRRWEDEEVPVITINFDDEAEAEMFAIADNRASEYSSWKKDLLQELLARLPQMRAGLSEKERERMTGFSEKDIFSMTKPPEELVGALVKDFLVAPFTVLDSRSGAWQERKRAWVAIGLKSELGREGNLLGMSKHLRTGFYHAKRKHHKQVSEAGISSTFHGGGIVAARNWSATSIFDPVLCEIVYSWFVKKGGRVLDPFAGGSVRGILAAILDRYYFGVELAMDQVAANRKQWADEIMTEFRKGHKAPQWFKGDSRRLFSILPQEEAKKGFDLLFTCPPYYDLEVYSKDPNDLSALPSYDLFREEYGKILRQSCKALRNDSFAVIVVSDIRDKKTGLYRGFPEDTVMLMESFGLWKYNDIILLNAVGSLPLRVRKQMEGTRKMGRVHQQVLVFVKGDAKKATAKMGEMTFLRPEEFQPALPEGVEGESPLED